MDYYEENANKCFEKKMRNPERTINLLLIHVSSTKAALGREIADDEELLASVLIASTYKIYLDICIVSLHNVF